LYIDKYKSSQISYLFWARVNIYIFYVRVVTILYLIVKVPITMHFLCLGGALVNELKEEFFTLKIGKC
jgi:hypothetical protein